MSERMNPSNTDPRNKNGSLFIDGAWRQDWYDLFEDKGFATWLRDKKIRVPIFEYRKGIYRLIISTPLFPEKPLPTGYWYKGGCARTLFFKQLGLPYSLPRDIDLVKNLTTTTKNQSTHPLIQEADAVELIGGYPAGTDESESDEIPTIEGYFDARDFTINEVIANDHELLFTRAAIEDAYARILKATQEQETRMRQSNQDSVKTLARALRLQLNLEHASKQDWTIDTFINDGINQEIIDYNPFYIFLQLDRLLERGTEWGEFYLEEWHKLGLFLEEKDLLTFVHKLAKGVYHYKPSSEYLRQEIGEISDLHQNTRPPKTPTTEQRIPMRPAINPNGPFSDWEEDALI